VRYALFWEIVQPTVLILCRRFGKTYRSHFKCQDVQEEAWNHAWIYVYERLEVWLHKFLTSTLEEGEWLAWRPGNFVFDENWPRYFSDRWLVKSRTWSRRDSYKRNVLHLPVIEPWPSRLSLQWLSYFSEFSDRTRLALDTAQFLCQRLHFRKFWLPARPLFGTCTATKQFKCLFSVLRQIIYVVDLLSVFSEELNSANV
jgi:hypothetical protein